MGLGVLRIIAVLGLAALAAACSTASPPAPPADPAAACLMTLDQRHVVYERVKDWQTPEGCGVQGAVRVKSSATQWNRPTLMSCSLATLMWEFETEVVEPAARRSFGRGVSRMTNAGSYDCRGVRGNHPERMSQHAFGRALDLTGFELDDGTRISVLRDWRSGGPKGQFLHQVAQGACRLFSVVITPDGNALHRDHFHLDIGPYKYCSNPPG